MNTIKSADVIQSVADALQYISYYHPPDYIKNLARAYELEQSTAAKDAMAQILINSRMCAEGHRPLCQDTGIVNVFCKVGMQVRWADDVALEDMINEGVRRAYLHPDNKLRASVLADPSGARRNTKDNTPAVIHVQLVPGYEVEITLAALAVSAFATFTPRAPAPTTTAERRTDACADRCCTTMLPSHTASHCSTGVTVSQTSSTSFSKKCRLRVA